MAHHLVVSLAQVVDVNRVSTWHARRRLRLLPRLVRVRVRLRVRARLRGQAQGLGVGVRVRVRCACCQCSDAKRHRAKIEGASSGASGASGSGRSSLGLGLGLGFVLGLGLGLGLGSANPNLAELGQESAQHRSLGGEQRAEPPRLVRGAWCVVRSGRRAVRVGSEAWVVRGG